MNIMRTVIAARRSMTPLVDGRLFSMKSIPASRYYSIMSRSAWMPVLIGERI
jgi:hypothetical protein